jgi:formate hydrogenlyase subunit 6/NADH:ubiquinone oxidoreductase subunit I
MLNSNPSGRSRPGVYSVSRIELNRERCVDCGACISLCAEKALRLDDYVLDYSIEKCIGCGTCEDACPYGALMLVE